VGEKIILCKFLVGKSEGKRELGKHKLSRHDIMKIDVDEMVREVLKGFVYFTSGVSGELLGTP